MDRRGRGEVARLIGAVRRDRAGLLVTTALTAAVLCVVALPAHAQLAPDTQPTGGVVVAGSAHIAANPTTTTVTQSSDRAAVNWQSFNVGSGATVNFVQPSASAVTLNRVLAPDPSVIAGHIHANGGIVITNRSGVVFTQGSEINAASVVVSAAGITNRNFMAGRMQFDLPAKPGARIVNAGHITVKAAGLAALVAPEVANSGVITATLGHVVLAGGAAAETLDLYGDGLVSLDVTPEAHQVRLANGTKATALVTNTGTILASGGTVQLTARQADGLVQDLVDAGGTIAANSLSAHGGTIAISGVGGSIRIPGTLLAVGSAPGTTGGAIALDATGTVALASGARIDASGAAGGGTVAIGTTLARARGGPGTTATLTASAVDIAPRTRIAADATDNGNGGHVTVLSHDTTTMAGAMTARGGPHGGNGGSAEISGENLSLSGGVDVSAPLGVTGSILLDPTNLMIVATGADDATDVGPSGVAYSVGGASDTVSASAIQALTGNVTLQATHNLEIATNLSLGAGQALTLQAGNNLTVDSGATVSTAAGNAITMDSAFTFGGTAGNPAGAITVSGAVNAGGVLTLNTGTGAISIPGSIGGSSMSLSGSSGIVIGGTAKATSGDASFNGGTSEINITGSISAIGHTVTLMTTGAAIESRAGAIDATTLTGSAGSGASLIGSSNSIDTLAAFDASPNGIFNLEDKSALTVTGTVTVPTGGFLAIETDSLTISGGVLSAPEGTVRLAPFTAARPVALVGNNSAVAGALTITKDDVGGVVAGVLQIGTTDGGAIVIGGATGGGVAIPDTMVLNLVSGSGITEKDALSAGELEGAVGSATLTAGNTIATLGNFSDSSGGFSLTEANGQALLVAGKVSVPSGQTIALTADGITIGPTTGSLVAPGGMVSLTPARPDRPLDLTTGLGSATVGTFSLGDTTLNTAAITAATLAIGSVGAGALTVTGALALPDIGLLDLLSGSALSETTTDSLSVSALAADVASASLIGTLNAIGTLDAITATGGFTLADTGNLALAGVLNAGNATVQLNDPNFAITEQGGSITAGLFTGNSASATLNDANQIGTLSTFSASSGGFNLKEAARQTLAVTGAVSVPASQTIALTADGIALGAAGALSAAGGSVTLAVATPGLALELTTGHATASVGTFSLGDAIPDSAAITAATLAINAAGTGGITVTGPILFPDVGFLDLLSGGTLSESTGASLSIGTLTADVASANLVGGNAIGTLGAITATGGFTLADTENLALAGVLDAGSATVQLNDTGFAITESSGSITAGTLKGSAASATLTNANAISTLGAFAAPSGFSLTNDDPLTISGALNASSGQATFTINGGSLSESGSGAITAETLAGTAQGVSLGGPNEIGALGSFASGAGFSLTEAAVVPTQTLSVTGAVSVPAGQTIALTTDGLQISGPLSAPSGTVKLAPASANVPIALNAFGPAPAGALSINDSDLSLISAATLEIGSGSAGPIVIGNSLGFPFNLVIVPNSVTSLILESGGAINENGTLSAPAAMLSGFAGGGTLTGTDGTASFANANTIASLGGFIAPGGLTFAEAGNLFLAGPIDVGNATAGLTSVFGRIEEEAGPPAGTISAGTLAASAAGSVVLAQANSIATLGNIASPGGFTLDNPAGLFVAGNLNAGNATLNLTSSGALVETTGSITAGLLEGTFASATLGGANKITDIATLTARGGFSLTNDAQLTISGAANFGTATGSFAIAGGLLESGAGVLTAGTLSGSAANVSLPNGANNVGTLGAFSAPGGLTLATANALAISDRVDTGGAAIALTSGGSITEIAGGTLIGAELLGFAGGGTLGGAAGTASFANTNTLAALGSFTALGGFTLANTGNLALLGPLDAGSATVVLTGGAAVTEPSGSITAATLSGTLASAVLGGANRIGNLANFSAGNGFSLANLGALTLTGPVSAGGAEAAFTLGGTLVQTGAGILTTGTLAGSAALIDLTDPANRIAALGAITAPGGLLLATATDLRIAGRVATGSAPIFLEGGADITEVAGGSLLAGALTGSANAASFANTNSIAELGSFTAPGGFTLDNGGNLPIAGPLDAGAATALLIAGGSLYETTTTIFGATTLGSITAGTLTGRAGTLALDGSGENLIANLGSFAAGAFNLADGENLAVIGAVTGNPIGLTINGNLALGSSAGSGILSSGGAVFLTATGAITEPAGAIDAAILTGSAASASLGAANLVPLLGPFTTAGSFLLSTAGPALTLNGPLSAGSASLVTAGSLALAGHLSAHIATLSAGGAITEPGGVIAAGTLAGSAADATLTAANSIATLGSFTTPGTLLLTDTQPLAVAGPVTASFFGISDSSSVSFTGATDAGTLDITALGSITEPSGAVTAALLEGSANGLAQLGPDAPAGSASITTLGPFSVTNGTFTLTDSVPLNIIGPLTANDFAIAAPGSIVLTNATITTIGLPVAQQSGTDPARPGSYFDVTTPAGRFLGLGQTTINPAGEPATVRIQLNTGGELISFADLVAPTTSLILDTGAGDAVGRIDLGALIVIGNLGSSNLTGTISNLSGLVASSKATISPFQSAHYRLNSCPLMSVNCIFIAPPEVPQGNPLSGIAIVSARPDQRDLELLLPNVAAKDY